MKPFGYGNKKVGKKKRFEEFRSEQIEHQKEIIVNARECLAAESFIRYKEALFLLKDSIIESIKELDQKNPTEYAFESARCWDEYRMLEKLLQYVKKDADREIPKNMRADDILQSLNLKDKTNGNDETVND